MNDSINESINERIDRKQLLKEKKELKSLEKFQYERVNSLRRRNLKEEVKKSLYEELNNEDNDEEQEKDFLKKGKKRGRKSRVEIKDKEIKTKQLTSKGNALLAQIFSDKSEVMTEAGLADPIQSFILDTQKEQFNNSEVNNKELNNILEDIKTNNYMSCEIKSDGSTYITNSTDINNKTLKEKFPLEVSKYDQYKNHLDKKSMNSNTFINCDLRYFNFDLITSRVGYFDVIMLDPPWRIKGGQRNDSSFMFSNSKFNLEYNTLSNNEILSLPVEKLSKRGFCFLWVLNSLLDTGYECLNKWGYDVVDQLTWVKLRNNKLYISQGYYFLHSSETCLVGYKCPQNERVDYKSKVKMNKKGGF